jgi:hypothetical protein
MANGLYVKGVEALMKAGFNLETDTIKITLVDTADYTVDLAAHDFINDVPAGARVATQTLASKSVTGGAFDAADVTFPLVTGDPSEAMVIWKDTGVESTSPLLYYIDTATGLPVTPNGGDITVAFDNGANKIFKIINV